MIVVIGSGPTGLSAARTLLGEGLPVLLLDIDNNDESRELHLAPPKDVKNKSKIFDMNRVTNITRAKNSSQYLQQSIARGGFSKVWGAAISTPSMSYESYIELFGNFYSFTKKAGIDTSNRIGNLKEFDHILAVRESSCASNSKCNLLCPTNSIWSSEIILEELMKNEKFSYLGGWTVTNLRKIEDYWLISSNDGRELVAKKIILCAGPIGTTQILFNSGLIEGTIEMLDSTSWIVPFFKLRRKRNNQSKVAISLSSNSLGYFEGDEHLATAQLYTDISSMEREFRSALSFLPKWFLAIVWKYTHQRIGFAFVYLNSMCSPTLFISKSSNGLTITRGNESTRRVRIHKISSLIQKWSWVNQGLLIAPFRLKRSPGDSFHVGGSLSKTTLGITANSIGELPNFPNLHILDSSIAEVINAGPVTPLFMKNTIDTVRKLINIGTGE